MLRPCRIETLWTLQHDAGVARCKLVSAPDGWRLVLLINKDALQTECCCRPQDATLVAQSWKAKLMALGWRVSIDAKSSGDGGRTGTADVAQMHASVIKQA